jgi:glucose-1-phosphate cytidylyltransferase
MAVRPNLSLHFLRYGSDGLVTEVVDAVQAENWINAGYFAFRGSLFEYIRPGEELVLEPFRRLIELRKLATLPYDGFWRCCDTFKDLRILDSLIARGSAPWEVWSQAVPRDQPVRPTAADHSLQSARLAV